MINIQLIADKADMIINGYAFTLEKGRVRVLNLNNPDKAMVLRQDGKILETNMDDIEGEIVCRGQLSFLSKEMETLSFRNEAG